jgi:protein phosphatase
MVNEGRLTSEQAEVHPQRSILTRALGADRDVDVEELNVPLVKGDRLILCSDGLSGVLAPDEIRALAGDGADLDEICKALIDEANERGGPDNITAVVVEVEEGAALGHRKHVARPARAGHTRRVPLRPFVWAAIVIGIVAGGYYGVRAWADRSYYVGVQDGKVAIYRGLPVEVGPLVLSNVEEPTRFLVEDVKNPAVRRSLAEGIRAGSIEDARRIVAEQIAPYVAVTPPKASPSPSTTRKKR